MGALMPIIHWLCQSLEDHVPSQSRCMTGVLLADKGRRAIAP
jgi:hypothetical protein